MDPTVEIDALHLLEQVLSLPPAERDAWLTLQRTRVAVRERVRGLLARSHDTRGFLETPAVDSRWDTGGPALPVAGDRVGAWRIVRELDAGGMGVVFLGRRDDGTYEQQVAIKFV
ncbi:MAG: hypothetical protein ABIR62_12720, partial [Dokdonella sp.]